ncbi:MAG: hypothetical protein IPH31_03885 [Lewinellaceae bacterium]|nr:hypothetical protein [Lewinellaceae bacterium]
MECFRPSLALQLIHFLFLNERLKLGLVEPRSDEFTISQQSLVESKFVYPLTKCRSRQYPTIDDKVLILNTNRIFFL